MESYRTLGGGSIDGYFGKNPDWSKIKVKTGRTIWSSYDDNTLQAWAVEDTNKGGFELAGGNYANPLQIAGNGLPRIAGYFVDGFVFENPNQVGIDASGNSWQYVGTSPLPYTVATGTVPSAPDYEKVFESTASNVTTSNSGSVQDFIDSQKKDFNSVSDMIASSLSVGELASTGATTWRRVSVSNPSVITDFTPIGDLYINDFGLFSDGTNPTINDAIMDQVTSLSRFLSNRSRYGGLSLKVKGGYYVLTETFNVGLFSTSIVGEPCGLFSRAIFKIDGSNDPVMTIYDTVDNNPVNVSGFYSENVEYMGDSRSSTSTVVKLGSDDAVGVDIDAKFVNCKFSYGVDLVECWGRGLMIESSEFVQFNRSCVSFNWPSSYPHDSDPSQTPGGGFRTNRLLGNRAHSGTGHLVLNVSAINASNLQLQVAGSYIDTFCGLLNGSCINSDFSDNTVINANNVRCFDIDSMVDTNIDNTTFTGANGVNTWDTQIFLVCRSASSVLKGVSVTGGNIKQLKKEVIRLNGEWDDVRIDGVRMKDVTLDNDTQGFALPIVRLLSDGTNLTFTNNVVDIPDMTDKVPLVYLTGRSAANNTGHTIFGNKIPSYCVETDFSPTYASNALGDFGVYTGDGADPQQITFNTTARGVVVSARSGAAVGNTFIALTGTGVAGPGVKWDGATLEVSGDYNLNNQQYNYIMIK